MVTWQSEHIDVPKNLDPVQGKIYSEVLLSTLNSPHPIYFVIKAGAGSGKTTVATLVANSILKLKPDAEVRLITFTRAASGVMKSRLLNAGTGKDSESTPRNVPATTLHSDATEMLTKLNAVVGGVGYYHQKELAEPEAEEKDLSMRLAVYSTIAYGSDNGAFPGTLAPFMKRYGDVMPIGRFLNEDYQEAAESFTRFESLSEAGLTAFANGDVSDMDYIFPVATDAILRYIRQRVEQETDSGVDDGIPFGPRRKPAWVIVDEVQDLSFIQYLYVRALLQAGHHVILIGDPRQTLYEFRDAIGSMPFDSEFVRAFLKGTGAEYVSASESLLTNYRSRRGIIDLAEGISEAIKKESETREDAENLRGPIFCEAERGHPYESEENIQEKRALSVTFYEAGVYSRDDHPHEIGETLPAPKATKRASELLKERRQELKSGKPAPKKGKKPEGAKGAYRKGYAAMLGGPDGALTVDHLVEMARRSQEGDTAAILYRMAPNSKDVRLLQDILRSRLDPDVQIEFQRLSGNKDAPMASYPYLTKGQTVEEGVPPSSILLGGVCFFLFTWSQDAADRRKAHDVAALNSIPSGKSREETLSSLRGSFRDPIRSIELDLYPFLEGLLRHSEQIFPQAENLQMVGLEPLGKIIAEFTLEVLARFSVIVSRKVKGGSMIPCRFRMMTTVRNAIRRTDSVASPSQSKFYFQAFWQAIATTPLLISPEGEAVFRALGLEPEWIPANGTLPSMMEETTHWRSQQQHLNQTSSLTDEDMEVCIQGRASIHQQMAKLYHSKTKTFTSSIVKKMKAKLKDDMSQSPADILEELMKDGSYKEARREAGIGYQMTKRGMTGFFNDLIKHKNDGTSRSIRPREANSGRGVVRITLATFHASKGLEWDHVMILFPDPIGLFAKTSIRAMRDLTYVAVTRAARTLAVVITKPKDTKETSSDTSVKVARKVVYDYALGRGLFRQKVEWTLQSPETKPDSKRALVFDETHHSELEKAQRCSRHHFIQEYMELPSMSPLPEPDYSFFFHSTMSAVAAAMARTRLQLDGDGAPALANLLEKAVHFRTKMLSSGMQLTEIEGHLAVSLCAEGIADAEAVMEGLVPLHFSATNDRHTSLLRYYAEAFLQQMAGIIVASRLFDDILTARKHGGHTIYIESSLRGLPSVQHEGEKAWLPMVGVPDVRISGPLVNMIYDYKTINESPEENEDEDRHITDIARSTVSQMTLYQWLSMSEKKGDAPAAEVIYVADITVFSWKKVPEKAPHVVHFRGLAGTQIVTGLKHAFSMRLRSLNRSLIRSILDETLELRLKTLSYGLATPLETFEPEPLVGERKSRVSPQQCIDCQSRWHCEKPVMKKPASPPRPSPQVVRRKGVRTPHPGETRV